MRHIACLIALAASLALTAAARAQTTGLLLPAVQVGGQTVALTADQFDIAVQGDVTTGRLILPYVTDDFRIDTLTFSVDPDPFINLAFDAVNFTDGPLNFIISIFSPFVGGPYSLAESEVSATVTDTSTDGAALGPATQASQIELTNIGIDLLFDCVVAPRVGGSNTCGGNDAAAVLTGASGTFAMVIDFVLTTQDMVQVVSELVISPAAVPEPRSVLLLALGLAGFGFARWLPSRLAA